MAARGGYAPLIKLALVGAGGLYVVGEAKKAGGIGPWLNQLAGSITSGVSTTAGAAGQTAQGAVTGQASGTVGSAPGALVSSGVYTGSAADILAQARAAGVTSAADPRADQFGAALWSLQSGQPMSAFASQPQSVRATFDSVATRGS